MVSRKERVQAAEHLNSAAIHLLRGLRSADRYSGLTAARLSALSVLVFGGPCALGELARAEDVSGPTMTRIVDGLVRLGLAARTDHPDSRRQVLISATAVGQELMAQARDRRLEVIAHALGTLRPEDQLAVVRAADALRGLSSRIPESARQVTGPGVTGSD